MMSYIEQVKEDVLQHIENEIEVSEFEDREELERFLNDDLFINDGVTGNGSGSYTFNRELAKAYVMNDNETVVEALKEFCVDSETIANRFLSEDWEYFDVTARCYVLTYAIGEALDYLEENGLTF